MDLECSFENVETNIDTLEKIIEESINESNSWSFVSMDKILGFEQIRHL